MLCRLCFGTGTLYFGLGAFPCTDCAKIKRISGFAGSRCPLYAVLSDGKLNGPPPDPEPVPVPAQETPWWESWIEVGGEG